MYFKKAKRTCRHLKNKTRLHLLSRQQYPKIDKLQIHGAEVLVSTKFSKKNVLKGKLTYKLHHYDHNFLHLH